MQSYYCLLYTSFFASGYSLAMLATKYKRVESVKLIYLYCFDIKLNFSSIGLLLLSYRLEESTLKILAKLLKIGSILSSNDSRTVSYTHLDVYKRQIYNEHFNFYRNNNPPPTWS